MIARLPIRTKLVGMISLARNNAILNVYTSPMPSTGGGDVGSAILLAQIALSNPIGVIANDVLTFDATTPDMSADATGDMAWFRIHDPVEGWILDGDITLFSADPKGLLTTPHTLAIQEGGVLSLSGCTLTVEEEI